MTEWLMGGTATDVVVRVGAILAALGAVARFGVLPVVHMSRQLLRFLESVNHSMDQVRESLPTLLDMAQNFRSNGGSSLSDVIQRIDRKLDMNDAWNRIVVNLAVSAYVEFDSEGRCSWVSERFCRMTGLMPSSVKVNGWINAVTEADRARVMTAWTEAIDQQRDFDTFFELTSGERVHMMCRAARSFKGSLLGYIGTLDPAPLVVGGAA